MSTRIPVVALLAAICMMFIVVSHLRANDTWVSDGSINAVIGDRSFIARFGVKPDAATSYTFREQIHLAYVEQLLRAVPLENIPPELRAERLKNLDRLHEYRTRGIFPQNTWSGARPCFIDNDGNICAVGYLVERSAGRAAAEEINHRYQHALIAEMNSPLVERWIAGSGLTKTEAAMIQPVMPDRVKTGSVQIGVGGGASLPIAASYTSPLIDEDAEIANAGSPLLGHYAGLSIQYKHGARRWPFSLLLNGRYEDRSMSITAPGIPHLAITSDGTTLLAPTRYHADIDYHLATVGLMVMLGIDRSKLEIAIGSSVAKVLKSGRDEALTLDALPASLRFLDDPVSEYDNRERALHNSQNELSSGSIYQYSIVAGVRYPIPLLDDKDALMLTPSIWYDFGLTPVLYGTKWRSNSLQLGVELQLEILELIDYR
jgi:hypothetical protein